MGLFVRVLHCEIVKNLIISLVCSKSFQFWQEFLRNWLFDSRSIRKQLELKVAREKTNEDYFDIVDYFDFWVFIDLRWVKYSNLVWKIVGKFKKSCSWIILLILQAEFCIKQKTFLNLCFLRTQRTNQNKSEESKFLKDGSYFQLS